LADDPGQGIAEDGVVHGRKVFDDVHAQDVRVAAGKRLQPVEGSVRALATAVRVAAEDETALEPGFDDVHEGVMDDAVAEGSGAD
jgi:hypothetical protein